jgi:hypothetical protein
MKKGFIILLVVVIIAAIGAGVYFGLKKYPTAPTGGTIGETNLPIGGTTGTGTQGGTTVPSGETTTTTPEQAQSAQEQLQKLSILSIQPAIDYLTVAGVVTKSTTTLQTQYYLNRKGEMIWIRDVNKEEIASSATNFGMPVYLKQNADGSKAVVYFDSGKFAAFDSKTRVWTELDSGISGVTFSPSGKNIAFMKSSDGNSSIYTRDPSSSKKTLTLVATLAVQDFDLAWPDANKIFLVPKSSNRYFGEIWYFDLVKKSLNRFSLGSGLSALFSWPYDYGMKFASQDRSTMEVSITDKTGKKLADMPFSTVYSKCSFAFDAKAAYCAIPETFSKDSVVLPDDYLKGGLYTQDAIYKIDLVSAEITRILDSSTTQIDAVNLRALGDNLYFINRYDGQLYRFNLK